MLASLQEDSLPNSPISLCARRLRHRTNLAPIDERDRRIEDHLVTRLDAAVDFDPRAKITLHVNLAELRLAVVEDGDLHSVAVEDDRFRRYQEARRLARDMELDRTVDARSQSAVRISDVDFSQQRPRARLQRIGNPSDLAGEVTIGQFRHANDSVDPRRHTKGYVLRHV